MVITFTKCSVIVEENTTEIIVQIIIFWFLKEETCPIIGVGKDEGGNRGDGNDRDDTSDGRASCARRREEEQDYLR